MPGVGLAGDDRQHQLLATGADPVIPPVRGNSVPLRTLNDARTILRELNDGVRRVAVVGGGPLGVETACALAQRGVRVELLHRGPHIMFSRDDLLIDCMVAGLGRNVRRGRRNNRVAIAGALAGYPLENDLAALPLPLRSDALISMVRARATARETCNLADSSSFAPGGSERR